MYILGISCYFHDAAAALLKDGVLIAAAEEERFSRKKHDFGFPEKAIDFCLREGGIRGEELGYVVFYEKPLVKFERILLTTMATFPGSARVFRESMITWLNDKLWIKSHLMQKLNVPSSRVLFTEHHLSHASSAFFCSPFREAAILTVDGVGEWTTASIGVGRASWENGGRNEIRLLHELKFPHSLGLLYSAFTAFLGFEVNEGEYKVMGMAPYGEPRYLDKVARLLHLADDGSFRLNMEYFSFHHSADRSFTRRFEDLFGPPRPPESEFVTRLTHPGASGDASILERNQYYADVAASVQHMTEEVLLRMARRAYNETGLKTLCLAGGVALNSAANGRIVRETPFEEVYIQPAAGDAGGALGAALYAYHVLLQKPRRFVMEHGYWGAAYSEDEVRTFLDREGIAYEHYPDEAKLLDRIADDMIGGKVVGWFQGRFEWGPRALGNRSILADPRRAGMKDIVNRMIKYREPFRPFAPVVLAEKAPDYFEGLESGASYPARFMLLVYPWKKGAGDCVPAVNHRGTGRLQTVRREWNPRYWGLVQRFGESTGVPILMNTSFNLRGEPIVTTPGQAWKTFCKSGLDVLALESCVVRKR